MYSSDFWCHCQTTTCPLAWLPMLWSSGCGRSPRVLSAVVSILLHIAGNQTYHSQQTPWGSQWLESDLDLSLLGAYHLESCRMSLGSWLEYWTSRIRLSTCTPDTSSCRCPPFCCGRPNLRTRSVSKEHHLQVDEELT